MAEPINWEYDRHARLNHPRAWTAPRGQAGDDTVDRSDGGRPIPAERRIDPEERFDGGDSVDELPRYGGAGFF
jgi:hypothetical protein